VIARPQGEPGRIAHLARLGADAPLRRSGRAWYLSELCIGLRAALDLAERMAVAADAAGSDCSDSSDADGRALWHYVETAAQLALFADSAGRPGDPSTPRWREALRALDVLCFPALEADDLAAELRRGNADVFDCVADRSDSIRRLAKLVALADELRRSEGA
jgi:hypothetical protein